MTTTKKQTVKKQTSKCKKSLRELENEFFIGMKEIDRKTNKFMVQNHPEMIKFLTKEFGTNQTASDNKKTHFAVYLKYNEKNNRNLFNILKKKFGTKENEKQFQVFEFCL